MMQDLRNIRLFGLILLVLYGEAPAADEREKAPIHDYTRTEVVYNIPNLSLVDKEGHDVELRPLIDYGGPVLVQFIFSSCSTICPILSAAFSSAQPILDTLAGGVYRLISISIDPEQDTPKTLAEYAKRFKAGKHWYFLTGNRDAVSQVLKAFDATYTGNNKMYHQSLTFMRASVDAPWIRIEGMLGKKELVSEYQNRIDIARPSN